MVGNGLCDKKIVEENNYVFAGKMNSNGCFIISTNNMVWHSFDKHQRKKILIQMELSHFKKKILYLKLNILLPLHNYNSLWMEDF